MIARSIAIVAAGLIVATAAPAAALTVVNASFETLPAGGLPNGCGTGCAFSTTTVPGWTESSGAAFGQFRPGSASGNFAYFDYVPDGVTVAYLNGGSIAQTLGATAIAGHTYVLTTDFGVRHDLGNPGSIQLSVGSGNAFAIGLVPVPGSWSTFTASYTATVADAGGAITITLASPGGQGDFDNVTLNDTTVPEPASWALMIVGFGLVGGAVRRRSATVAA